MSLVGVLSWLRAETADFLSWWIAELRGLIPGRVAAAGGATSDVIVLQIDARELVVTRNGGEGVRELARLDAGQPPASPAASDSFLPEGGRDAADIVLRLPIDRVVRRQIELPLGAEADLRRIIGFEIERQTPFQADQAYFDYRVLGRDRGRGRLAVELVAAARQSVDDAIALASAHGLDPDIVDVQGLDQPGLPALNLMPRSNGEGVGRRRSTLRLVFAAAAATAIVVAIIVPLNRLDRAIERAKQEMATARQEAAAVDDIRGELDQITQESQFMTDKRRQALPAILVLDEVTRVLPIDSWLFEMHVNGKEVRLVGFSTGASNLIRLMEESPRFERARFRSPLMNNQNNGFEQFDLSVDVVSEGTL